MNNTASKASQTSNSILTSGYSYVIASTLAAALSTVVGKWNLNAISPLLMNSLIFSIAASILSVTLISTKGFRAVFSLSRKGWFWLLMFSASSWLAIWAFWAGVQRMDPSLAAFLNRLEVPVAILLGIIILKEHFTKTETLGAILSLSGIVVMRLTLRFEYSSGFWLVLTGALFFGITEFISKIAVRHVQPSVLTYIRNMFIATGYWIAFFSIDGSFEGLGDVWTGVVALGILGPIFSRMMYLKALQQLALSKVAVISQSQPVLVLLIAFLALGQLPAFREIMGGLLLVIGSLLMISSQSIKGWKHRKRV